MKFVKRNAFTLAETLIVLAVIGVVAALTLPSVISKYQKHVYVNHLKKVYMEFSQAALKYMADNAAATLTEAGMTSQEEANNFVRKYFKVVDECEIAEVGKCFAKSYKRLDGTVFIDAKTSSYTGNKTFILSNGAVFRLNYSFANNKILNLNVDINGLKGPNTLGRDRFGMFIYNNGVIDDVVGTDREVFNVTAPLSKEQREESFNMWCMNNGTGGCFAKILNDGWAMKY